MKERGVVVKSEGNVVTVRFMRKAKCDRCQICTVQKDCKYVETRARNEANAKVGDEVEVHTVRGLITLLIGLIYAIPLLLIAVAVGVGAGLNWQYTLLIAAAAIVLGFAVAVPVEKRTLRKMKGFAPTVVKVLGRDEARVSAQNEQAEVCPSSEAQVPHSQSAAQGSADNDGQSDQQSAEYAEQQEAEQQNEVAETAEHAEVAEQQNAADDEGSEEARQQDETAENSEQAEAHEQGESAEHDIQEAPAEQGENSVSEQPSGENEDIQSRAEDRI